MGHKCLQRRHTVAWALHRGNILDDNQTSTVSFGRWKPEHPDLLRLRENVQTPLKPGAFLPW